MQDIELKQILITQKKTVPQRPSNPVFATTSTVASLSRATATPNTVRASSFAAKVPVIDGGLLSPAEQPNPSIGSGCFGSCVLMVYRDLYPVCVKMFRPSANQVTVRSEAAILCMLNSEYTPHCFGICEEKHAIVMSYITLSGTPMNLHNFLTARPEGISFNSALALQVLLDVSRGLLSIHASGVLHNDIKLDNIALGNSATRTLKAYIIDFGKACLTGNGRKYQLSPEQIALYKQQYPHVAPDLRDGKIMQSPATDVYSLGRVIRKVNQMVLHSDEVTTIAKQAMHVSSSQRPSISDVVVQLQALHLV